MRDTSEQAFSAGPIRERLVEDLNGQYALRSDQPVAEFLSQYPFLLQLLLDAITPLRRTFGAATIPVLELVGEDDAPGYAELFATVHSDANASEALAKLDEFDRLWWLDAAARANGRLNFTVESR